MKKENEIEETRNDWLGGEKKQKRKGISHLFLLRFFKSFILSIFRN